MMMMMLMMMMAAMMMMMMAMMVMMVLMMTMTTMMRMTMTTMMMTTMTTTMMIMTMMMMTTMMTTMMMMTMMTMMMMTTEKTELANLRCWNVHQIIRSSEKLSSEFFGVFGAAQELRLASLGKGPKQENLQYTERSATSFLINKLRQRLSCDFYSHQPSRNTSTAIINS